MPPVKQKTTLPTFTSVIERKRKLFQCTGFGDCNMVFTRSEHLARHIRKHTGEKPFKCVVPGCNRMFSRFDNMKQHTQTHQRNAQFDYATTPSSQQQQQQQQSTSSVPRVDTSVNAAAVEGTYNCGGLMSPVSLGSPEQSQLSDMWGETASSSASSTTSAAASPKHQGQDVSPSLQRKASVPQPRRLPVADLCNHESSSSPSSEIVHLTMDELEALEALAQFRGAPLYHDSLRHLANVASHQYPTTYASYD